MLIYARVFDCDTLNFLVFPCQDILCYKTQWFWLSHRTRVMGRARDQKEVQTAMNKYELALVVDAKIEDEVRAATVEKAKDYVTKAGGSITNVEEWGKKKLAYEIRHMKEGFYYFIQFDAEPEVPGKVEQVVRIMDNVLRYLCVRQEA